MIQCEVLVSAALYSDGIPPNNEKIQLYVQQPSLQKNIYK